MIENLKPCPFCGGDAVFEEVDARMTTGIRWSVGCREGGCVGYQSMTTFDRRSDAAKAWNRRAADQQGVSHD